MMRVLGTTVALLGALGLAGCEDPSKRIPFEGQYFRTSAKKVDKQRDVMEVTVRGVSKSPAGARQAAYHAGVSYCVTHFGTSQIIWQQDPLDDTMPLNVERDDIRFQGRCPQAQKI